MAFFSQGELSKVATKVIDIDNLVPDCFKCKLDKGCISAKIGVSGEGRKGILVISEFPSEEDDIYGTALSDDAGKLLGDELRKHGISLNRDCWKICAVSCRPTSNAIPTHNNIKCCFPKLDKLIKTLKPKLILSLGSFSNTALFGEDFSNRSVERWRGYEIPDQRYGCFILPLFPPHMVLLKDKDKNLRCLFNRDIKRVSHCLKRTFKAHTNYEQYVTILTDYKAVVDLLNRIITRKQKIAFDYETTGLKPQRAGHKLSTIGIAVSPTKAFAFPFDYKSFWTEEEFENIKNLWKQILKDKNIKKIAQNFKFEDNWSKIQVGTRIRNIHWDTMMAERILDNRKSSTGLKFQTYVSYGILPYDKFINPFLVSKNGEFNTIEKAPFKELLLYNGLDCIYTFMKYKDQTNKLPRMKNMYKAYKFFMRGLRTMGTIQLNGIYVDMDYYRKTEKELEIEIKGLNKYLHEGREATKFKETFGKEINIASNKDLGKLFYEILGKPPIKTASGNYKTDKPTLEKLNLPFVDKLLEIKKLEKCKGTYLAQFVREEVKGKIHPFWDLHIPVSYRSCIAGYEKVLVMRDFESHPEGIPIKDIKVGDYVYCFDNNINPAIRKVLWQGKTGHREVIRVHYYRKGGHKHFDCTPEHLARLINGEYVETQNLLTKQHYEKNTPKSGNCRVLACKRNGDKLNFTGHLKNGTGILEHRLIYENFIGKLTDDDVVHHKDKNHFNHDPLNLEKHTKSSHAKLHAKDTICSKKSRENSIKAIKKGWKEGKYDHTIKRGSENINSLNLTKNQCLYMLMDCAGKPKKTADKFSIDFSTFKKYLDIHDIDWKKIHICFDKNEKFISKQRLIELSKLGRSKVQTILGHNHYRLIDLYDYYNIDSKRKWGNQFGEFKPGNHVITKIEWIKKIVDVYDIEVEDFNNFFVNEICVHNSGSRPNFQNIPARDPKMKSMIRKGIIPTKNYRIGESDFSSAEVITSSCYHKDPTFIKYLIDPTTDMHRDLTSLLFILPADMLKNKNYTDDQKKLAKMIRFYGKNNWTFAQFYGDWFGSCAPNLWANVVEAGLKLPTGITVREHLESKGIYELGTMEKWEPTQGSFLEHCKEVEDQMWNVRFPVYTQWKKDIVEFYQKYGFIENFFGFRFQGYMDKKQCANFPIQSCSFHLLLYTLNEVQKFITKNKLKTRIIGQVHDSCISSIHKDETYFYLKGMSDIVNNLPNKFPWLIVPIEIEHDLSALGENGGNFSEMKTLSLDQIRKM